MNVKRGAHMKKHTGPDDNNEKELAQLKEALGIDPTLSPDRLKNELKQLVERKVISNYKINKEK
jgi:hypothetical protein